MAVARPPLQERMILSVGSMQSTILFVACAEGELESYLSEFPESPDMPPRN
jgi:hypothetical protein